MEMSSQRIANVIRFQGPAGSPTLICLHGGPGMDPSYFFPALKDLRAHVNVVSFKQGTSGSTSIEGLALEVENQISASSSAEVFLLGHSWGAALALEVAQRRGIQSLGGLILIAPIFDASWSEALQVKYGNRIEQATQTVLENLEKLGLNSSSNEFYRQFSIQLADLYFSPPFVQAGKNILSDVSYDRKLMTLLSAGYLRDFNLASVIEAAGQKLQVITGSEDAITPIDYVRRIKKINPKTNFIELDGASHFPFIERPHLFRSEVIRFIELNKNKRIENRIQSMGLGPDLSA